MVTVLRVDRIVKLLRPGTLEWVWTRDFDEDGRFELAGSRQASGLSKGRSAESAGNAPPCDGVERCWGRDEAVVLARNSAFEKVEESKEVKLTADQGSADLWS